MTIILTATLLAAVIGALLALIIGVLAKIFAVQADNRVESVTELLPGVNCGGCGFAGCADMARALVEGRADVGLCPVCSNENAQRIAAVLGVAAVEKEKVVAVVRCSGSHRNAVRALYNGINDCKSAVLVAGGAKGCDYGCLGLASCARACPFAAIEIRDGLAVVHPELCVGCGKCVSTCPKNLIVLAPAAVDVHVYCNSPERGPVKRKVCQTACIACRKCVKAGDHEGQMTVAGFLVRTNYQDPPNPDIVERAGCPTTALRRASAHADGVYDQGGPVS